MGKSKKSKRRSNTGLGLGHDTQAAAGPSPSPSPPAYQTNPAGETSTGHGSTDAASSRKSMASSSEPCLFFDRGYCRNGDSCRFRHSESSSKGIPPSLPRFNPTSKVFASPFHSTPKSAPKKLREPQECLDFYRTGSCPRYRTCRYAHPPHLKRIGASGSSDEFGDEKFLNSFKGVGGSLFDQVFKDVMEERMANCGFTDDDIYELSLQGIKPWDPEAADALAVLNGWDMDSDDGYGDDYLDDVLGRKMSGFGFY